MKVPGLAANCLLGIFSAALAPLDRALVSIQTEPPEYACPAVLKRVHDEVAEMGRYPGQDFVRWDFFIGGPDDDDTNKDQHVVVLIENGRGPRRMILQVTQLERSRGDPKVKYARGTRRVLCFLEMESWRSAVPTTAIRSLKSWRTASFGRSSTRKDFS